MPLQIRFVWVLAAVLPIWPAFAKAADTQPLQLQHAPLHDAVFGVQTTQPGLRRIVLMYQWQRKDDGFVQVWSSQRVDSRGFPAGFDNPAMPFATQHWQVQNIHIDGAPVDEAILPALGQWREFRPAFTALPNAIGARFQPEGNGLGTAENPQKPHIGDVRVFWQELQLPPLQGKIQLQHGRWQLVQSVHQGQSAAALARQQPARYTAFTGIGRGAAIAAAVLILAMLLQKRRRHNA